MIRKIEPGDVIGRCRIIRELGRGGVGTVYLATHQTLQIEVALKILSPTLSLENPALAERFIREAQLAARIRHPHVIAVMDAAHDETTGLYFIVQEYVGGGALSWHLRNGPLSEQKALAIITGIANALVVAEENGIVHRDIKPDNIMLDLRGTSKLADLGLAKNAIDSHTSLTLGGSFMGTPAYMSPEQARDAKVADTRDDIYSLGATLYECLTGEAPFRGETPYNIMSELLTKPSPKPRARRPELSQSIDMICRKMMAKTRGLRYPDARTLVQDLHHCHVVGDSGIDGLEAFTFEQDSIMARQQARDFGIQTSGDGAAPPVPELPDVSLAKPRGRLSPRPSAPSPPDYGAFRAAAILIVVVIAITALLAILSGGNRVWRFPSSLAMFTENSLSGRSTAPKTHPLPASIHVKPAVEEQPAHSSAVETPPPDVAPAIPSTPTPVTVVETPAVPAAPVETASPLTPVPGTVPALPVDSTATPTVAPVAPVLPENAFEALDVAEESLPPALIGENGHAPLLKIRGKRAPGKLIPPTWTFDFFDPTAVGRSRMVSVTDHRVLNDGERLSLFITPYTEANILPADIIDSSQALQIAQQLVPTLAVSSSEFYLAQDKNHAPSWNVTLWTRNPAGDEVELGNVVILAEKGDVILNTLKPERIRN